MSSIIGLVDFPPSFILESLTSLETPFNPDIFPVGSFLLPLPLPKLSISKNLPTSEQPRLEQNQQPSGKTVPESILDAEATWFTLRDRDTVLRADGIRVHRNATGRKRLRREATILHLSRSERNPKNFKYKRVTHATKSIWKFLGNNNIIKLLGRKHDIIPILPFTIRYSAIPVVGPFRQMAICEILWARQVAGLSQILLVKQENVAETRRVPRRRYWVRRASPLGRIYVYRVGSKDRRESELEEKGDGRVGVGARKGKERRGQKRKVYRRCIEALVTCFLGD